MIYRHKRQNEMKLRIARTCKDLNSTNKHSSTFEAFLSFSIPSSISNHRPQRLRPRHLRSLERSRQRIAQPQQFFDFGDDAFLFGGEHFVEFV